LRRVWWLGRGVGSLSSERAVTWHAGTCWPGCGTSGGCEWP
jgi:hypothetical protein